MVAIQSVWSNSCNLSSAIHITESFKRANLETAARWLSQIFAVFIMVLAMWVCVQHCEQVA